MSKWPVGTKLVAVDSTAMLGLGTKCTVVAAPRGDEGEGCTCISFTTIKGEFFACREYEDEFFEVDKSTPKHYRQAILTAKLSDFNTKMQELVEDWEVINIVPLGEGRVSFYNYQVFMQRDY